MANHLFYCHVQTNVGNICPKTPHSLSFVRDVLVKHPLLVHLSLLRVVLLGHLLRNLLELSLLRHLLKLSLLRHLLELSLLRHLLAGQALLIGTRGKERQRGLALTCWNWPCCCGTCWNCPCWGTCWNCWTCCWCCGGGGGGGGCCWYCCGLTPGGFLCCEAARCADSSRSSRAHRGMMEVRRRTGWSAGSSNLYGCRETGVRKKKKTTNLHEI